jgi:DNA helicase-2/ATP-dependent DNA helicase PcrA
MSAKMERRVKSVKELIGGESKALDDDQLRVARAPPEQRMLVLAGPGSGKTEVSARRIEALLGCGLRPVEILVLSFSRAAVRTLSDRMSRLPTIDDRVREDLRHLTVRTFDSWTFRMLRNAGHLPHDLLSRGFDSNIEALGAAISAWTDPAVISRLEHVRHVIVDEMQDLAGVRGDLVIELLLRVAAPGGDGTGFTLLGDSAQAIYGFANRNSGYVNRHGETTAALLESIRRLYGSELVELGLDRNYRCERKIDQRLAPLRKVLLGASKSPEEKHRYAIEVLRRFPEADAGLDTSYFSRQKGRSVAILARTNGEVLRIAQRLFGDDEAGPKFQFQVGHRDICGGPAWIAGLLAKVRSSVITREQFHKIHERARTADTATEATCAAPPADIAWKRLSEAATDTEDASSIKVTDVADRLTWPGALPDEEGLAYAPVCITTTHQSKGREFDHVAILEHEVRDDGHSYVPEEEASVVFVALSRAGTSVERLPSNSIYVPPIRCQLDGGKRQRLKYARNGWVNLEMGLEGDVCLTSFADIEIHGSEDLVAENFRFISDNCERLAGRKVVLEKKRIRADDPSRYRYAIHLQENRAPGRLLGMMNEVIVKDLLSILYDFGYSLPSRIFNLRISRVVSLHDTPDDGVRIATIFERSGMWLGVELFGTGDFRPSKRQVRE